ncbi:MAG: 4-hydroxy-tetrahydrodipicolinate synthase [Firmicutes bacterium]|nr:4-hydroxy-tetrahydrodipicolinate synthase [Bacillota bacterium]
MPFGRLITAMVTPFNRDFSLDLIRTRELALRLVEEGSEGIVVAGTTGESPTLSMSEKLQLMETVVEAVGEKAAVGGTGTYSTAESVALTRKAEVTGIKGIMLVTPYYNKPPQEGLYQHFKAIAEATRLPVLLYNVPSRTGVNLQPPTTLRLARIPNIVAIKEASGDLNQVGEILRQAPTGFSVYSGDDNLLLPILSLGGYGVVSVASHLLGKEISRLIYSHLAGDVTTAAEIHRQLLPLFRALFVTANPIPVKTALREAGFPVGPVRPPLWEMEPPERSVLRKAMESLGLVVENRATGP